MLISHGMTTGLPYWDSTLDSYLDDPYDSAMWSDVFMGQGRGVVDRGSFSMFPVMEMCILNPDNGFVGSDTIERTFADVNLTTNGGLYMDDVVDFYFSRTK